MMISAGGIVLRIADALERCATALEQWRKSCGSIGNSREGVLYA